jgi:hypothetical protein
MYGDCSSPTACRRTHDTMQIEASAPPDLLFYVKGYDNITCLLQSTWPFLHNVTLIISDEENLTHYWNSNDATRCKTERVFDSRVGQIHFSTLTGCLNMSAEHDEHTRCLFRIGMWCVRFKRQLSNSITKTNTQPNDSIMGTFRGSEFRRPTTNSNNALIRPIFVITIVEEILNFSCNSNIRFSAKKLC